MLFLGYREIEGTRMHSTFRILEIHDHEPYTDALEIHAVELSSSAGRRPATRGDGAWAERRPVNHPAVAETTAHLLPPPEIQELARLGSAPSPTPLAEGLLARRFIDNPIHPEQVYLTADPRGPERPPQHR